MHNKEVSEKNNNNKINSIYLFGTVNIIWNYIVIDEIVS